MSTCSYCYQRGHNKRGCPSLWAVSDSDEAGQFTARIVYVDGGPKSPLRQWRRHAALVASRAGQRNLVLMNKKRLTHV